MTTLYEKRGRRYRPVHETDAYDGLPNGAWLVLVNPGCTTIRKVVAPARAEVLAAAHVAREAMHDAMHKAMLVTGKLCSREMTEREKRAWQAYCDVLGGAPVAVWWEGVSASEIVDAGIAALVAAVEGKTDRDGCTVPCPNCDGGER